jgi:hypothetical protein
MRAKPRTLRLACLVPLSCGFAAVLANAGACGGRTEGPKPVAHLASSTDAAAAFDAIRNAWSDEGAEATPALRARIEQFLERYPHDGLVPEARVLLALTALRANDLALADAALADTRGLPPGSAHDLWTIAEARSLRLHGDPEGGLALLRPLVGKPVDPLARTLFDEELTLTALATHREYEGISYMDAWLRATSEDDKPKTIARVAAMVQSLPKDVLIGALQAMRAQRASFGYGVDIERVLSDRLVQIATTSSDANLARILLDADAGLAISENAGAVLGQLATSRRGLNVVAGRTIGLLLPTDSSGLRDESADVLRGVMWALGLPRGVRRVDAPTDAGAPRGPVVTPCAAPETAPELEEPRASDGIRLVTRNDAGRADETDASLDELVGEGATAIVAGLDGETAARALTWANRHGVAVIALAAPDEGVAGTSAGPAFGFRLGEPRSDVVRALAKAATFVTGPWIPVVDSSEESLYRQPAGEGGGSRFGLSFGPVVSCEARAKAAGESRFPLAEWEQAHARAWLVSGSPACADDVVDALAASRRAATADGAVVALTLEAATTRASPRSVRVFSAQAGVIPGTAADDPRAGELRRFSAALGALGWWAALGRDAATLARLAARALPLDEVSDPAAIAARRVGVRDALATARAPLWTSEKTGFDDAHAMERTVCAWEPPRL